MKIVYDKKYLEAMKRRQELDQMIQKFSNDGCLLVEDLFQDYLADYDSCDFERSYAKLAVTLLRRAWERAHLYALQDGDPVCGQDNHQKA